MDSAPHDELFRRTLRNCLLINLYFGIFNYLVWFQSSKSDTEFLRLYLWFRRSENPEEGISMSSRWTETFISRWPFWSDVCQLRLGSSWSRSSDILCRVPVNIRELKQPQRRQQQKPHKFASLAMKNSIFARFVRAFFIFWHFENVLVLSKAWNEQFCNYVDDVSTWWQMFNFVLCPRRGFQLNARIVRTHFSRIMT